jgi:hypothetical protein
MSCRISWNEARLKLIEKGYKTINMLLKNERPTNDVPPLRNPNDIVTSNLSYEGVEKCEILNKYVCSITDLEDDGIDLL